MPRDVSGNYTLPSGVNPVVNNTLIDVAWANPTLSDIATQLNNVLTRDGLLGPILPLKLVDGTVGAPSLCFGSQPTTGFYKTATGFGFSISGTNVFSTDSAGTAFNGVVLHSAGTASAPSISITSDTNTGIYAPAADALGFTTGGVERMRFDSNGNVLVNTITALNSAANRGNITIDGTASSILSFGKSGASIGYVYADATKMQLGTYANVALELITNATTKAVLTTDGIFKASETILSPDQSIINPEAGGVISINTNVIAGQSGRGGKLAIVSGADSAGISFCALWLVAISTSGGASPVISLSSIGRAGSTSPTLTWGNSGNTITLTIGAAGSNQTYVRFIG